MDQAHEGPDDETKDRIFDATLDELRVKGIDGFTIEDVAKRAKVDLSEITGYWHDWRVLLMDAQLTRARQQVPTPKNGNLEEDFDAYAKSLIEVAKTAQGRRWFHRNLPNGQDTDFSEVRSDFWSIRFTELLPILLDAGAREELRDGIDPLQALQAFSAALYYNVVFTDSPIDPRYAAQVIDIFLHGILRKNED